MAKKNTGAPKPIGVTVGSYPNSRKPIGVTVGRSKPRTNVHLDLNGKRVNPKDRHRNARPVS